MNFGCRLVSCPKPHPAPRACTRFLFTSLDAIRFLPICASISRPSFRELRYMLCKSRRTQSCPAAVRLIQDGQLNCVPFSISPPTGVASVRHSAAFPQSSVAGNSLAANKWLCSCTHIASRFQLHPKCEQAKIVYASDVAGFGYWRICFGMRPVDGVSMAGQGFRLVPDGN